MHALKALSLLTLAALVASNPLNNPISGWFSGSTAPVSNSKWSPANIFAPGSAVPSKAELTQCVTAAAERLGIDFNMKTDPAVLKDILTNDMHLNDMPEIASIVGNIEQPVSLNELLKQVQKSMTDPAYHPAVGATICSALVDPTTAPIFTNVNKDLVKRSIHHGYLLQKLVTAAANDHVMMEKIHTFMAQKTRSFSSATTAFGRIIEQFRAAGLFGVAKARSINGALDDYITFRGNNALTRSEERGRKRGLTINVIEATLADKVKGHHDNSYVGRMLAWDGPDSIRVTGPKRMIEYTFPDMEYAQHYQTWNLAFILGSLDFPNMLLPKLLIPAVSLATKDLYLFNRVLALWLSINFYLMADLTKKPHINFQGHEELALLWGKINVRYIDWVKAKKEGVKKTE